MIYLCGYKKIIRKLLPTFILLFLISGFLYPSDLIYTKSARTFDEGRLQIAFDIHRYTQVKTFRAIYTTNDGTGASTTNQIIEESHTTYEMIYIPIKVSYGMLDLVQFGVEFPFVLFIDPVKRRVDELSGVEPSGLFDNMLFGDFSFNIRFKFDNKKKNSSFNIGYSLKLKTGTSRNFKDGPLPLINDIVLENVEIGSYDTTLIGESGLATYPLTTGAYESRYSFYYTRELVENLLGHFNITYVGEHETDEGLWTPGPPIISETYEGKRYYNFTFFNLDRLFKKNFWIWSSSDPWKYRLNDSLEYGLAFEYYFKSPLTISFLNLDLAYKVFIEFNGVLAWDPSSSRRSSFSVTPGIWLRTMKYVRFLFGYSFMAYNADDNFYNNRLAISVRIMI